MTKKTIILIIGIIMFFINITAQRTANVCGEYTYYAHESETAFCLLLHNNDNTKNK